MAVVQSPPISPPFQPENGSDFDWFSPRSTTAPDLNIASPEAVFVATTMAQLGAAHYNAMQQWQETYPALQAGFEGQLELPTTTQPFAAPAPAMDNHIFDFNALTNNANPFNYNSNIFDPFSSLPPSTDGFPIYPQPTSAPPAIQDQPFQQFHWDMSSPSQNKLQEASQDGLQNGPEADGSTTFNPSRFSRADYQRAFVPPSSTTNQRAQSRNSQGPSSPKGRSTDSGSAQASKKRKLDFGQVSFRQTMVNDSGEVIASVSTHGISVQQRKKMDSQELEGYRHTRGLGACEVCRKSKKRCNRTCAPYINCLAQQQLIFLHRPEVARLFRLRPATGHPLASTKREIYGLLDISQRPDYITFNLSQGMQTKLGALVAEFEAHPDLKTRHVFRTQNGIQSFEMPRYCLTHLGKMKAAMSSYIDASWRLYLQNIILDSDPLTKKVLEGAYTHAINTKAVGKDSLVNRALQLLAVNRMIERNWTIIDPPPSLKFPTITDPESLWYGKTPITPVMDTQLDQIIIQQFLKPLGEALLRDLQAKMEDYKKENWFEIFLVVFILQTNMQLLLRHSRNNAKNCGASNRYNSIPLAQEYFHSSNILLAHFHYMGGKGAGRKSPLQLDLGGSSSNTSTLAKKSRGLVGLLDYQIDFLRELQGLAREQADQIRTLRQNNRYEDPLFWSGQMLFDGWVPVEQTIHEDV